MFRLTTMLALLVGMCGSGAFAQPAPSTASIDYTATVDAMKRTTPQLAEEFTTGLTPGLWDRGYSPWPQTIANRLLPGNNERQIYVDSAYLGTDTLGTQANSNTGGTAIFMARRMDKGTANRVQSKIRAEKPSAWATTAINKAGWMSSLLKSRKTFGPYGYFEASIMWYAQAEGWPAFWLLGQKWAWPPEPDIVEMKIENGVPMAVMGIHSSNPAYPNKGCRVPIPNGGRGYHRYGFYWDKSQAVFFLDGKESCRMPTPTDLHQPFYPLLNLAVGGWGKEPSASTPDILKMQVDYVRFWKL